MGNQIQVLKLRSNKFKPGSVVIITGASSGIGRELAINYAQRNCSLLLAARTESKLKEVQKLCTDLGGKVEYVIADVSKEEDCKNIIQTCIQKFNRIDIMVLNAGINAHARFDEIEDLSVYKKLMDTNFYGYLYMTKYALPYLKTSKGQILVLSSMSGEIGLPERSAYCSSKFAVTGFFESLRIEMDNPDLAITIVCPPSVKTPMRDHDILKLHQEKSESQNELDDRMTVEDAVKYIMLAADKRARKIYFPIKAYTAVYLRPFFPDYVDRKLKEKAKL